VTKEILEAVDLELVARSLAEPAHLPDGATGTNSFAINQLSVVENPWKTRVGREDIANDAEFVAVPDVVLIAEGHDLGGGET